MVIVGFHWARDKHDVCVQDVSGTILLEKVVAHRSKALGQLRQVIAEIEPEPGEVHVALEQHVGPDTE